MLGKYDVQYYKCQKCLSLQTDPPNWLDEAYINNLSSLDTGAVQRNLNNMAAAYAVCKISGSTKIIDVGGGDGLLCRLLRDYGLDCYVADKYAKPSYAQGFTLPGFGRPDLVMAFEVLEHFSNPKQDLGMLFEKKSDLILVSTAIYSDEDKDWWYLTPESGQHVFFYSKTSMELLAKNYGYTLLISGNYMLFARGLSPVKSNLIKLALRPRLVNILRSIILLFSTPSVAQDHELQRLRSLDATICQPLVDAGPTVVSTRHEGARAVE